MQEPFPKLASELLVIHITLTAQQRTANNRNKHHFLFPETPCSVPHTVVLFGGTLSLTYSKQGWFSSGEVRLLRGDVEISKDADPTASGLKGPASMADLRRALMGSDPTSFMSPCAAQHTSTGSVAHQPTGTMLRQTTAF